MSDRTSPARDRVSRDREHPDARRGWTLALASLGVFLTSLDVVVVAVALPTLQRELHAGLAELEWTINAYNLSFACFMLTGAALGDRFGRRRGYVVGLTLFVLASAASALSTTAGQLVAARVVQGVGAALILPLTLTLITDAFPVARRGAAIGIWGGISGLGVAAGPVLGGIVVEGLSWQWIFWLNVPVGAAVAVLTYLRLGESHGPRPQLDLRGLVLAALAMVSLTWAPVRAPSQGWGSVEVIGTLAAGLALLGAFIAWERRAPDPMLPLAYFRRSAFVSPNGVAFFQFVSLLGSLFMVTQLFQLGLGYSPVEAGVRILVWMAMPMIVAPLAGAAADRVGDKPLILAGMVLQGAGLGWLAAVVEPGVGYGTLVAPLAISGIGISLCLPTVATAVVSAVPVEDTGVAAGTNSTLRELGGVFGIAVVAAVFAANGGYESPERFIAGFVPAMAVAAIVPVLGVVAGAYIAPRGSRPPDGVPAARRAGGLVAEGVPA